MKICCRNCQRDAEGIGAGISAGCYDENCSCHPKEKECCELCIGGFTTPPCLDPNCPCHHPKQEDRPMTEGEAEIAALLQKEFDKEGWEERFDEKFGTIKHRGFPQQAIKSFINDLLEQVARDTAEHFRRSMLEWMQTEDFQSTIENWRFIHLERQLKKFAEQARSSHKLSNNKEV